jgi:hypothetical protein
LLDFLADSEAFVRRAALELLCGWTGRTHTLTYLYQLSVSESHHDLFKRRLCKVMDDFDWEVKLRGIRFFASLLFGWLERSGNGSATGGESRSLFFRLEGDRLLFAALDDSQRLVRLEVAHQIRRAQEIISTQSLCEAIGERSRSQGDTEYGYESEIGQLWNRLALVNCERIIQEAKPEEQDDEFLVRHVLHATTGGEKQILDCPF